MGGESLLQHQILPASGLIQAIIQDVQTREVLTLVTLNQEALEKIAVTGRVHFYHPRQRKVMAKGENSGHFQEVQEIRRHCQEGILLILVKSHGGGCEDGYHSCFYRQLQPQGWIIADPQIFDPEEVYPEFAFSH
jgi:phosphoribosyl-AMP cyclohydrolase